MSAQRAKDLTPSLAAGSGDAWAEISGGPEQHAHVQLDYVVSGEMTCSYGGLELTIPSGRLAVFWAGFSHRVIRAVNPTPYVWVRISLEGFLAWRLPAAFKQAVLAGQVLTEGGGERRALDFALFQSWVREAQSPTPSGSRWTLLEIEARLGRLAESTSMADSRAPGSQAALPPTQAAAAARIAVFLDQHYREPVYWEEVARAAGLSVVSARRCFARAYGHTLHQYLRQLRVARAKQMIANANTKIIDIALETGFPTLSNFYHTFEAVVGQTPSAYRKSLSRS